MYVQTVCTRPLLGEECPGNETRNYLHVVVIKLKPNVNEVGSSQIVIL